MIILINSMGVVYKLLVQYVDCVTLYCYCDDIQNFKQTGKNKILLDLTYKKFMKIHRKAKKVRLEENGEQKLVKLLPSYTAVLQQAELLPQPENKKRGRKKKAVQYS